MSDERDPTGSAADGADSEAPASDRAQTAVASRPLRPTGKRARRAEADGADDGAEAGAATATKDGGTKGGGTKDGGTKDGKAKTAKKDADGRPNPVRFVINYLQQVIAELRKVIWPNRKQMSTYTTVVLMFLAFMVAMISGADYALAWMISQVFG